MPSNRAFGGHFFLGWAFGLGEVRAIIRRLWAGLRLNIRLTALSASSPRDRGVSAGLGCGGLSDIAGLYHRILSLRIFCGREGFHPRTRGERRQHCRRFVRGNKYDLRCDFHFENRGLIWWPRTKISIQRRDGKNTENCADGEPAHSHRIKYRRNTSIVSEFHRHCQRRSQEDRYGYGCGEPSLQSFFQNKITAHAETNNQ